MVWMTRLREPLRWHSLALCLVTDDAWVSPAYPPGESDTALEGHRRSSERPAPPRCWLAPSPSVTDTVMAATLGEESSHRT